MIINIAIIALMGTTAGAIIASVDRKVMKEYNARFKMHSSFKTGRLRYTEISPKIFQK